MRNKKSIKKPLRINGVFESAVGVLSVLGVVWIGLWMYDVTIKERLNTLDREILFVDFKMKNRIYEIENIQKRLKDLENTCGGK